MNYDIIILSTYFFSMYTLFKVYIEINDFFDWIQLNSLKMFTTVKSFQSIKHKMSLWL